MNPEPRTASLSPRRFEAALPVPETQAATAKDERLVDVSEELEPHWEALKDTATD